MYFCIVKHLDNEYISIIPVDNVLHATYKVKILDIESATICINTRIDNLDDYSYPIFIDATSVTKVTKEARVFLSSDYGTKQVTAAALFIESPIAKMIGNFLINVNKPNVPTKLFTNKEDALNWLKSYPKEKAK